MIDSLPTVLVEPSGTSEGVPQWKFWCPFCNGWHGHGGEPDARGNVGRRVAHCWAKHTPFKKRGYILITRPETAGGSQGSQRSQ
jgi:hypothetical protein